MEELKLAMVQEEVEVAVVEELRVVKAVVEAMEGVGGGRMIGGLWPLLKEGLLGEEGAERVGLIRDSFVFDTPFFLSGDAMEGE